MLERALVRGRWREGPAEEWPQVTRVVVKPAVEPVSLAEAKTHLRIDGDVEDGYVGGLIEAARLHVEMVTWRALCTQTVELEVGRWPEDRELWLPRPPLQSVVWVKYTDPEGVVQTLGADQYAVDVMRGRVRLAYGASWPAARGGEPVVVRYVAGYGVAADVPGLLKRAMLLLVGHWYENREAVVVGSGTVATEVGLAVDSICYLFRA